VHVKALLEVLQPFVPDDSCTIVSAIGGLGADPLTETKLMRSEPVLGETYSGFSAAPEGAPLGTLMVKIALPGRLFAVRVPGTEPPPPHPAIAKRPTSKVAVPRVN
jgi:hypothetical protein